MKKTMELIDLENIASREKIPIVNYKKLTHIKY